jgi:transposase
MMSWRRGKAYAQDLRDRVLAATGRLREVAERFGVSQAYVSRVRSRHERLGQASAGAQHNHVPLRLAGLKAPLLAQVALAPEQTLVQLCQWVRVEHGIEVGPTAMGKTLARLGLTRKKRRCMLPSKSEATSRRRARTGPRNKLGRPAGG